MPQKSADIAAQLAEAIRLHRAGRRDEAMQLYDAVLELQPENPDALHLSGLIAADKGLGPTALERLRRATELQPDSPLFLANFGLLLSKQGQTADAIAVLRRSLALDPNQPEVVYNLGNALRNGRQWEQATVAYQHAVALRPNYIKAMINLAYLLEEQGRFDEAELWLRKAIAVAPDHVSALNNLANLTRQTGKPTEAAELLNGILLRDPHFARGWNNLGSALRESGQTQAAIAAYRRAVDINPDYPEARMNLGMALLADGQYTEGWQEFEYRWQAARELQGYVRDFPQPQWRGEDIAGKTILAHAEQGFGDALQFFRYVQLLLDRGTRVVVECHPELVRLFSMTPGLAAVIPRGAPLPAFDVHCPFMSLALAFGTAWETIPDQMPFLHVDPEDVGRWKIWLGESRRPRVGLVWKGNPRKHDPGSNLIDRRRSLRLDQLAPILVLADRLDFICLQKGHEEILPATMRDPSPELRDFADSAALITQLDLVITVDTAVAHLVGGLAKPVWMLSRFDACWRWRDEGETSPWYPTMRIFRQASYGDWSVPLNALREALSALPG